MTRSDRTAALGARLSLAAFMASLGVGAQAGDLGTLEEIVVTAQKREQKLQDVPISITALTAQNLEAKGIATLGDVAMATPSVTVTTAYTNRDQLIIFMRGMGAVGGGQDGSIGFYEDGFFIGSPYAVTSDMADLERVEVLRGPQGTLYGKNTTGGAINIISKAPTGEFRLKQTLDFGNRSLFRSLTSVDLPEVGNLSAKITFVASSVAGFVENPNDGSNDFNEYGTRAGRLALRWKPTERFSVDYFFDLARIDLTSAYFQNDSLNGANFGGNTYVSEGRPLETSYRPFDLPSGEDQIQGHGLTATWQVNDGMTIKSLTGYREVDKDTFAEYAEVFGYAYNAQDDITHRQFSQEFQLIGTALNGRINYVGGLYYVDETSRTFQTSSLLDFGPDFASFVSTDGTYKADSRAAYGQVGWTPDVLDQQLELTLGARYTEDRRKLEDRLSGFEQSLDFDSFDPALIVDYQWTEDLSTYAKVSTGYRSGGIALGIPPQYHNAFDPETVTTYEIGVKSDLLDGRLRLNAAIFDSKYEDMQVQVLQAVNDPNSVGIYNLARATIRGLELDLLGQVTKDFSVDLSYSYLDAALTEVHIIPGSPYDSEANPAAGLTGDIKGLFAMPYAPENSVGLGFDYTFARLSGVTMAAHADYRWQSEYYTLANAGEDVPGREFETVDSYGIVNARLTLIPNWSRNDQLRISVWAKNLTDERHWEAAIGLGGLNVSLPGAPAGFTSNAVTWSEPRSYGVSMVYQY